MPELVAVHPWPVWGLGDAAWPVGRKGAAGPLESALGSRGLKGSDDDSLFYCGGLCIPR